MINTIVFDLSEVLILGIVCIEYKLIGKINLECTYYCKIFKLFKFNKLQEQNYTS